MITNTPQITARSAGIPAPSAKSFQQLWQVPVFLAGILSLLCAAAAAPFAPHPIESPIDADLAILRQTLESSATPSEEILGQAEAAVGRASRQPELAGEAHYLLGALYLRQAERSPADRAGQLREKASMHLELAELLKVPAADQARLTYLRGVVAYNSGNMMLAIDLLTKALPAGTQDPGVGYGLLVQAQLRRPVPDLDAALEANLRQLETADENTLTQARMTRGELFLKKEMRAEAIKALNALFPGAPLSVRLKARHLQAMAAMELGQWGSAIPWWNELLDHKVDTVPGGKGRINYNLGLCWMNLEPPVHYAEAAKAWSDAQLFGGEEAQAAALRLAELQLLAGTDATVALRHFKDGLEKVSVPRDYRNSLVDLRKVRELLESACRLYYERRLNEQFLQVAELYKKVALPGVAEEIIGQAAEARGLELLKDPAALRKGKDLLVKAALHYEQAAENRPPAGQVDVLWRCFECYRLADEPKQAIGVLKKFVTLESVPKARKAEAWFAVAEIQKRHSPAEARESYTQCVAFGNPAFTSRARLELADMYLAELNLDDAEFVLRQVKSPTEPIVDFPSHQEAILRLASLYYQQRQYQKAIAELTEFTKAYPGHAKVFAVRERRGHCFYCLAAEAKANLEAEKNLTGKKRNYYQQQLQECLHDLREAYQPLILDLQVKASELAQAGKSLPADEEGLRRKARYYVAESFLLDAPDGLKQAFDLFALFFEDYRDDSDALLACEKFYSCWVLARAMAHPDLRVIQEGTAAGIEHCLSQLTQYERLGFRTGNRGQWQTRLEGWQRALQGSAPTPGV